jgi:phenylacetate-CoA ligase
VDGPFADPSVRRDLTERALRRTARRLARVSPFYAQRFAAAGVDPRRLTVDTVGEVPLTVKADLTADPQAFLCEGSMPVISTRTTGSTGAPAEVWLSRYEATMWPAFAALSGILRGEIGPTDAMQVCLSSRATAAVQQDVGVCRLAGARADVVGLVPPDEALDAMLHGSPTILATYPSYLAFLTRAAIRRGLGPADFRLRRIDTGGEVLSTALAATAREVFGTPNINDTFAMTEVLPVTGRTCDLGHLHHDLNTGHVEVLSVATGEPATAGELGTVVITPYFPYRECMPVFRYDTRDLVRVLPDGPLECELAGTPATSAILGKFEGLPKADPPGQPGTAPVGTVAGGAAPVGTVAGGAAPVGTVAGGATTRDLVEALESLPTRPWPARFRAEVAGTRLTLTVPRSTVDGLGAAAVTTHLADRGLDVDLRIVGDDGATALRAVRADLIESTFTTRAY